MPVFRRRPESPLPSGRSGHRAQAGGVCPPGPAAIVLLTPLLAGVLVLYRFRVEIFGVDTPVRIGTAVVLIIVGWALARGLGRALAPLLDRRPEPGTSGVVGFTVRFAALGRVAMAALRAGLTPGTIALGASFTAIIVGLAARQTFGNILAGVVLLTRGLSWSATSEVEIEAATEAPVDYLSNG